MNTHSFIDALSTPFGTLMICADTIGVTAIGFSDNLPQPAKPNIHTSNAKLQLQEYFTGKRKKFDLSLNPQGTAFQKQVWQQLLAIPFGHTTSYADIAHKIKNPKAVRAVGAANGRNPLTIVIPCHRVIGSNGKLTGYAWGTDIKAELLNLEATI